MKLFGEYLIEQKLVSPKQVVDALISQIGEQPSVAEAAFELKLLDENALLEVLKTQNSKKIGFIEAAKNLGVWKDSFYIEIEKFTQKRRKPLGEILVEKGHVKLEQVLHALDDFLANAEKPLEKDSNNAATELQKEVASDLSIEYGSVDLSAESILGEARAGMAELMDQVATNLSDSPNALYLDLLTEATKVELIKNTTFTVEGANISDMCRAAAATLHTIKGGARLVGAEKSEALIAGLETALKHLGEKNSALIDSALKAKVEKHSHQCIEKIWEMGNSIRTGKSETQALEDDESKKKFENLVAGSEIVMFDLSFI